MSSGNTIKKKAYSQQNHKLVKAYKNSANTFKNLHKLNASVEIHA